MGQGINTLSLELDDKEALALAQFVKRLTWSDLRGGPLMMTRRMSSRMPSINYRGQWPKKVFPRDSAVFQKRASKFLNALFLSPPLLTLCFYSLRVFGAGIGQLLPATWPYNRFFKFTE